MTKTPQEMHDDIINFLRQAWCIDGECHMLEPEDAEIETQMIFRLTDSKRGEFFVTISKRKEK